MAITTNSSRKYQVDLKCVDTTGTTGLTNYESICSFYFYVDNAILQCRFYA